MMFGHKTIYKVTNLKVHSKGRYLVKKNPFSRTTTNGSFGLQSCFPVFVTSQIVNPAYENLNGWGSGERFVEQVTFQNLAPFSVQRYRRNLALYHSNSTSCWQRINLHIYAAANRVSLWDYGI